MKKKNLGKKIHKLKARIEKDTKKLAKLTVKLGAAVSAGRKKVPAKKTKPAPAAKKAAPAKKAVRKLNLSPERRAELAATMKARWAAKRAATSSQQPGDGTHPS